MRSLRKLLLLSSLFLFSKFACADPSLWDFHPLHMGGNFVRVGKAEVTDSPHGNLRFRKSNVFTSMLTPINHKNIFIPRVELYWVTFDWNKNPKFHDTHFHYLQLGLVYYCTAVDRWKWIARFDYNLQTNHLSNIGKYSLYNGLLWGAYEINLKWHYHVGALGYAGLESFQIYPIIGFDYAPDEHWFLKAIFPFAYSVEYTVSYWTFALKGRPFWERLRAGSREPQPRSVFSYSNFGIEFLLRFGLKDRLTLEGWGGYTLGTSFYIKDQHGSNPIYLDAKSAPYAGGSLDFSW